MGLNTKSNEELNDLISYYKTENRKMWNGNEEVEKLLDNASDTRAGKIAKLFVLETRRHSNYKIETYKNLLKESEDFINYINKHKKNNLVSSVNGK